MTWATPGMLVRCVDAKVRKVAPGAEISDFEKSQVGIIDVLEILTVREVVEYRRFAGAWAVRFVEIKRGLEGIRRHHATKVYAIDRPFFLDRFVQIRDDHDSDPETVPSSDPELAPA